MWKGCPPINEAYKGECKKEPCICECTVKPVCGTDDQTYINECELKCYNRRRQERHLPIIKIAHKGECTTDPNCPCISVPVCGSDGRTYRNICYLQYESRQNELKGLPRILLKSIGPCQQDRCICPLNVAPVCASNDKTYSNECLLQCENRRRRELGQPQLIKLYDGECKVGCACDKRYNPVCGSDGNTYANMCIFNCENLRRLREGLSLLLVDYFGECQNCFCPLYIDEVCGSDGKVYSNPCFLGCENQKRAQQNLPPITEVDWPNNCEE